MTLREASDLGIFFFSYWSMETEAPVPAPSTSYDSALRACKGSGVRGTAAPRGMGPVAAAAGAR